MSLKDVYKKLTVANVLNGLFIIGIFILFFSPSAKALLIRGLMEVGLFQPELSSPVNANQSASLPAVSFQDPFRRVINLADQKGKVILINFWATWCPPCIAEMPSINQLYIQFRNDPNVVIIPVDADHDFARSVPFMTKNNFVLPVYNVLGQLPENLRSNSIPTTIIIDRSGRVVFRHEGAADYSNKKFIKYLLGLSKK